MKMIFGHGNSTLVVFAQDVIPNSSILTGMILLADKRLLR